VQVAQILSDKPITSILAGLGIGGLAVALAAQETIKNFFGSLVILADKPFELGDRIVVDAVDGTIESVGFRSTRLRTLDGELVTLPNGDLANRIIRNVGKRRHIRRVASLALPYDTPPDKVERALAIVRELLRDAADLDPDFPARVFFDEFRDSSLNLQVIYWFRPADWWACLAFAERLNLEILRRFTAEGIGFAFPTQTVVLAGDPARLPASTATRASRP
jgi:MscS family membrane protein